MRLNWLVLLVCAVTGCAHAPVADAPREVSRPANFVDAAEVIPGLIVDMRYHGSDNFVGRQIAGYEAPVCLLTREAVQAAGRVQKVLTTFGWRLKVYDCYRPARAVADFAAWARDRSDQKRKADYYPNVDKAQLFELGYIAERSGHSRGSTLDVTIVEAATGAELDMGSPYDLFDTRSWPTDATVSEQARANRKMLQGLMVDAGFRPLKEEWWHFTLDQEPYPETYFDFPVK
jgi:D-alanyl-D-alanine dipeptidase